MFGIDLLLLFVFIFLACVNAVAVSSDSNILLSGGDDSKLGERKLEMYAGCIEDKDWV